MLCNESQPDAEDEDVEIARINLFNQYLAQHLIRKLTKQWRKQQELLSTELEWGEQTRFSASIADGVEEQVQANSVDAVAAQFIGNVKTGQVADIAIARARFNINLVAQSLCTKEQG